MEYSKAFKTNELDHIQKQCWMKKAKGCIYDHFCKNLKTYYQI